MAYVDKTYPSLTQKLEQEVPATEIDNAIKAAASEMDSCFRTRYVLPIPTGVNEEQDNLLASINAAIALFTLSSGGAGTGRTVRKAYRIALKQLEEFKSGIRTLEGATLNADGLGGGIDVVGTQKTAYTSTLKSVLDSGVLGERL